MNYRHVYMRIISHAKSEVETGLRPKSYWDRKKNFPNQYFEFHHILPRSLFPNWNKKESNIIALTAREHFFCHQLLTKIYPSNEMYCALILLTSRFSPFKNQRTDYRLTSREYETVMQNASYLHSTTVGLKIKEMWERDGFRERRHNTIEKTHTENWKKAYNEKRRKTFENRTLEEKLSTKLKKQKTWKKKMEEGYQSKRKGWRDRMTDEQKLEYREKQQKAAKRNHELRVKIARESYYNLTEDQKEKRNQKRLETREKRKLEGKIYRAHNKGKFWWTNGFQNKFSETQPEEGWYRGMTRGIK